MAGMRAQIAALDVSRYHTGHRCGINEPVHLMPGRSVLSQEGDHHRDQCPYGPETFVVAELLRDAKDPSRSVRPGVPIHLVSEEYLSSCCATARHSTSASYKRACARGPPVPGHAMIQQERVGEKDTSCGQESA